MSAIRDYDLKELQDEYIKYLSNKGIESPCLLTRGHKVGNVIYLVRKYK